MMTHVKALADKENRVDKPKAIISGQSQAEGVAKFA
jgi:hypothetical protein